VKIMNVAYLVPLVAYLLGSIPTALIVSKRGFGKDIRELGDGNMGARNITRSLGWRAGILVAAVDVGKGLLAVLIPKLMDLSLGWQIAAAFCVVLGHDFPVFAHFAGGQGLAAILGSLAVLAPKEWAIGMVVYGTLYLITRHSDISAGIGVGLMVLLMWVFRRPIAMPISIIVLILTVPAKKILDRPRELKIQNA
jgi:glycerol-3-phosphate acyltransferase PlsY